MIRKTLLTLALLWMQAAALQAQVTLTGRPPHARTSSWPPRIPGAAVCYDAGDAAVVETAAGLFAADVARVTGREIPVVAGQELPAKTRCAVIVGTIGQSRWIDELIAARQDRRFGHRRRLGTLCNPAGRPSGTRRAQSAGHCREGDPAAARPTVCSRCRAPSA